MTDLSPDLPLYSDHIVVSDRAGDTVPIRHVKPQLWERSHDLFKPLLGVPEGIQPESQRWSFDRYMLN
jgi:hypothetical protein